MATEIRVPTLGESVTEATIGKWFKKVGEAIAADEPLVELETDKVTVEVPAASAGTLSEIAAKEGETVGVGALLGMIAAGGDAAAPATKPQAVSQASSPNAASTVKQAAAGTSTVTLSVSSSTSGSSAAMASPTFLNHLPMVASVTDSPRVGTRISVAIVPVRFFRFCFIRPILFYSPSASSSKAASWARCFDISPVAGEAAAGRPV